MQQNQNELKSQIRRLTFKFSIVGWLAAAITMGAMFKSYESHSLTAHLKQFVIIAGAMAIVTAVPLLISTYLASRWVGWISSSEDVEFPTYTKYCYVALIAIIIAVGGAGFLTILGIGIIGVIREAITSYQQFTISQLNLSDSALMLFLGAGYPIVIGMWVEIPMVFLYGYLVRKLVKEAEGPSAAKSIELQRSNQR